MADSKYCKVCKTVFPSDNFYKNRAQCKRCFSNKTNGKPFEPIESPSIEDTPRTVETQPVVNTTINNYTINNYGPANVVAGSNNTLSDNSIKDSTIVDSNISNVLEVDNSS